MLNGAIGAVNEVLNTAYNDVCDVQRTMRLDMVKGFEGDGGEA